MSQQPDPEVLQAARRQIIRSLLLSLAALGVIVIACYAWFVRNTSVSGALGSISAEGGTFELASAGSGGAFDDRTPDHSKATGESWQSDTGTITTTGKEAILWCLSDKSNLGNQSGNTGIRPGSHGKLVFYVIPKQDGTLTLSFNLELIPMVEDKNTNTINSTADSTANQLIHGHLLFSYNCPQAKGWNSNTSPTLVNYLNPTFTLTFENAGKGTPIQVELNWIWPLLLEHVRSNNLNDVCSGADILQWMDEKPEYFFYNDGKVVSKPTNLTEQFRDYNDYFNNADQYIGEHLDWLMVRLSAQQT